MLIEQLQKDENLKTIEMPTLFQDLNILLAQLAGWKNSEIKIEKEDILVSTDSINFQKFDFLNEDVILPIAQKYNKKAFKINESEWKVEYTSQGNKNMVIISHDEKIALALSLVMELCIKP